MRHLVTGPYLRIAFALATIATGAALFLLARPVPPVRAAAIPTLILGHAYPHRLVPGTRALMRFTPQSLPPGSTIDLLGVGAKDNVVVDLGLRPTGSERAAGAIFANIPKTSGRTSYWIAVDAVARTFPMRLNLAPQSPQPAGTPLAAILTSVPADDQVYLLGVVQGRAGSARIAAYIPPSACIPNPTRGGMVICNFRAPPGYADQQVSFEAYSTNRSAASLPFDNLPEVAWPAAMPIVALALMLVVKAREVLP